MINLQISDDIKEEAVKHSKERLQYEYNRFGLNPEKRTSMILIGTIGQLMFKEYLEKENVDFEFEYQAGNYDAMDFKLGDDIVEIKTSGYEGSYSYLNLLYSEDQFKNGLHKGFKYCVQIFIDGYKRRTKMLEVSTAKHCVISGFIPFPEISNFPNVKRFYGDDYKVPLNKLQDVKQLINKYK